jgi:hypothetical protein
MGTYLVLENHDQLYEQIVNKSDLIIVNDFSCVTEAEREEFNDQLRIKYTPEDILSNIPRCVCGEIFGWANKGLKCSNCQTVAESRAGVQLESKVWMRAPREVTAFINPRVWRMLCILFDKSEFRVMMYLTDRSYRPQGITDLQATVDSLQIPRGLNNFVAKFEEIYDKLAVIVTDREKRKNYQLIKILYQQNRDCFFPRYLPAPNHTLFVLEKTNSAHYVEKTVPHMLDAIRTLTGIDTPSASSSRTRRENKTIRTVDMYSSAHYKWMSEVASAKPGVFRKQVFAARSEFSFRAVIVSITDQHDYREVHVPWSISVTFFEYHITNKLIARGMAPNAIKEHLYTHAHRYSPLLSGIFDELIAESPDMGVPIILGRNPSLKRGSIQQLFITQIQKDPAIQSIALSDLVLRELDIWLHVTVMSACKTFLTAGNPLRRQSAAKLCYQRTFRGHRNHLVRGQGSRVGDQAAPKRKAPHSARKGEDMVRPV